MKTWIKVRAAAAEEITGMEQSMQRQKRKLGQLTPVPEGTLGHFDGALLAEMLLVHHLAPYDVVPRMTLTKRAMGSAWIAYHAAIAAGATAAEAVALVSFAKGKPVVTHMLVGHADRHWKDTILTGDIGATMAEAKKPVAVTVDLVSLGKLLARRAGALLQ